MTARQLLAALAGFVIVTGAFFAGIGVERSGSNPVPATVPVIGDKPDPSLVQQVGQRACDTRPNGYASDEGCPVAVGKGFRIGFHTVKDGWGIKAGEEGPVLTATVWNNNPGVIDGFWHTFHLNRYDGSLVEIVWCKTPPFAAGEVRTITCKPLNPKPLRQDPYDEVRIHY